MIKRTVRILVALLGGLTAVVVVGLALAAWRLSQGPVSLVFLTPMVEQAVNDPSNPFRIRLGDTVLTWDGRERALDVRFVNVRAVALDGGTIAQVPAVSVGLDVNALLQGVVAPVEIELFGPTVRLRRQLDGTLDVEFAGQGTGSDAVFDRVLADLLASPNPDRPMSYLEGLRIIDAQVTLEDEGLGISWKGSSREARLWHEGTSIQTEAFLTVALDDKQAELAMIGEYQAPEDRLDVGVSFDELRPAAFARVTPALKVLEGVDVPLRGTVTLSMDGTGTIAGVGFDLIGGTGKIALPVAVAQDIGVPTLALGLSVRGAGLHGRFERAGPKIDIDQVNITLEEGGTLFVPAPIDHEFPLASVTGKGRYLGDGGRVEVDSLEVDLAGPRITLSGAVEHVGGAVGGDFVIIVNDLKADELPRYWPRSVKTDAQEWSVASLSEGSVPEGRFDVTLSSGANGIDVAKLLGTFAIQDMTVDYLPPMPKVRKANGTATLDLKRFSVAVDSGEADGVVIRGGKVVLYDLDQPMERADIDLQLEGPVREVMELLNHEPLGYAKAMDIDPAKTGGQATARVKLDFPLTSTLGLDQLDVTATADVTDLFVADVVFGKDVTGGSLRIDVDKKGLDAKGKVTLGTTEGNVVWRENFTDGAPFASQLSLETTDTDVAFLKDVGLEIAPIIVTDFAGRVAATVQRTTFEGGTSRIDARLDATNSVFSVPLLGWKKEPGEAASGEVEMLMKGEQVTQIPRFAVSGKGLDISGDARFGAEGEVESIDLKRVMHGKTDLTGTVVLHADGGSDIFVDGRSLDLEPIWALASSGEMDVDSSGERDPKFTLTANIGSAWLGTDRVVNALTGTFVSEQGRWMLVQWQGLVDGQSAIEFSISPREGQTRALDIAADDAGATLRTLDIFSDMIGGTLKFEGTIDDAQPDRPLKGRLKVKDYRLINAPGLARLLSIMALTGILDALRGDGISFSKLDVPFTLRKNVLEITEAQASGTSLGVTAAGTVDVDAETFDIKGTVVPFYAVNSLLGKIPVLGSLLTGGEKGGGIFAALYTMRGPLNDPDVSVNPVSALAPGFLRNLFSIFDSGGNNTAAGKTKEGDSGGNNTAAGKTKEGDSGGDTADDAWTGGPQAGPQHP